MTESVFGISCKSTFLEGLQMIIDRGVDHVQVDMHLCPSSRGNLVGNVFSR